MEQTKAWWKSVTWWVNTITFLIFLLSQMPVGVTLVGSMIIYTGNLVLNRLKNNTPLSGPDIPLPFGITMKQFIYFINWSGVVVAVFEALMVKLTEHGIHYTPSQWVVTTIAILTTLGRWFAHQPKKIE